MSFTEDDLRRCLEVLQEISEDPSVMDGNSRFKSLVAKIHRKGKAGKRQAASQQKAEADDRLVQQTAIVRQQVGGSERLPAPPGVYHRPRRCYVCKERYTAVHFFYHLLCPGCAELNWAKRNQRADLSGRAALVTGGRIKIGFQTALKLLKDGARVIVTTRFPQDAALRFLAEEDHAQWSGRLQLHGLDLRDLPAVEAFARGLLRQEASLDILIHNAAQTVKRPLAFYQHLLDQQASGSAGRALIPTQPGVVLVEARPGYRGDLPGTEAYFPPALLDRDGQQVDQRPTNSWRLEVGEVGTIELLEVFLVGTLAPFVLTSALLPALARSPHARRFIVSVSAMEGQFARGTKNAFHPHTNMAKAALNMMTRTSANELAGQGVYLNSVDTGWITDEKPLPQAQSVREEQGFYLPLDVIDGASRVYDPIARGVNGQEEPVYGHFLKDYAPYPW